MPQFPFRQKINTEDSPDDQAQVGKDLPDYFKTKDDTPAPAKLPDYFKAEGEKSERQKAKDSVTFAGSVKDLAKFTKGEVNDFVENVISDKGSHPILHRMLMSQDPAKESVLPTTKEAGMKEPSTYWGGFAKGLYDEWVRPVASAAGAAGLMGGDPVEESTPVAREAGELPVRRPREIQPLTDTTPQQDAVAIALTKDSVPRTPANISTETGIPKPSIRRTISELKKKTSNVADDVKAPEDVVKPIEASEDKTNPDYVKVPFKVADKAASDDIPKTIDYSTAKLEKVPLKDIQATQDTLTKSVVDDKASRPQPEIKDLPVGSNTRPPADVPVVAKHPDGSIYLMGGTHEAAAALQRGESDIQAVTYDLKPKEAAKKPFVNPFQKYDTAPTELPIKAPGTEFQATPDVKSAQNDLPIRRDILRDFTGEKYDPATHDLAVKRLNMGVEIPDSELKPNAEEVKPTAKFAYHQPDFEDESKSIPMYNVEGGLYDKSSVSANRLKELGIDIPETPNYDPSVKPVKPKGFDAPDYFKASDDKVDAPSAPKKEYTIDNAPPNQRAKMFRGTHDPVQLLFKDPESREIFGSGQSVFSSKTGMAKPGILDRFRQASTKISKNYNIPESEARGYIIEYNQNIRNLGSAADKVNPDAITAPSFKEFMENKISSPTEGKAPQDDGIIEMQGGLGGVKPSKRELNPSSGPYGAALDKLFSSMGNIQEKRLQQDVMNKAERARRFAKFSSVSEVGVKGASESLSKLKGEYNKIDVDKLKMTQPQVDSLFTAIKRANISTGEKARGYTTLFKIFNGELPQRNELRVLDDVFGNNFADRIIEMHGGIGAVGIKVAKLANTMKSMENALSLAAPLRHGVGMVARKEFYPAFADMFKFFGNKEYFNESMNALQERPKYTLGRESGLFFGKPDSLMNSEEEFLNSYIGNIPGIRNVVGASNRAYTGFLNKLRADVFDSMTEQAEKLGNKSHDLIDGEVVPTKTAEAIANYVNVSTGRGSLGPLNKITNELNTLLWSPRMIASRIQMFNPKLYTDLPKGMRLDGLKTLLGVAALGTIIDTLGALSGAKVSYNILSTDFGKARFGTQLLDPWGGLQQYVVAAARFLAGKTDSSVPTSRLDIAGRFLANKESPAASLAHSLLTAKKFTGDSNNPKTAGNYTDEYNNKTSVQGEAAKRFLPIFEQDMQDLVNSDPKWADSVGLKAVMAGASLAGMAQNYRDKNSGLSLSKIRIR